MARLRLRLSQEEGFTLIELLVVIVIIGILLAIAVPSYLGFRGRAEQKAAASNVKSAIPAAEAYYSDLGNYTNMQLTSGDAPDAGGLKGIDTGLPTSLVIKGAAAGYCISDKQGSKYAKVVGPGGTVDDSVAGHCTTAAG
jgi:type IV pilus assembly protein PilA